MEKSGDNYRFLKSALSLRELRALLRENGFVRTGRRGSHEIWVGEVDGEKRHVAVDITQSKFTTSTSDPLYFIVMAQLGFYRADSTIMQAWERFYAGSRKLSRRTGVKFRPWTSDFWRYVLPGGKDGKGPPDVPKHPPKGPRQRPPDDAPEILTIILFADIVNSTGLTERFGDRAFRQQADAVDKSIRRVVRDNGGLVDEGKVLGDGVMALFRSAHLALDCAVQLHVASRKLRMKLHVGLHAGDVIWDGKHAFGGPVNIAARICAQSEPGQTLASEVVRGLARTSTSLTFTEVGVVSLRGIGEPQRLYAVTRGRRTRPQTQGASVPG